MASATKRSWRLQEFVAHGANVNCLALGHKSGRVLVTGGDDRKVNLWAVGKHNCILSLSGHVTPVECVKFNYTEEVLCAGSQAGTLKIWDLEASKIVRTLTGHKAGIRSIDFHPYGDFLVSGSLDTALRLWDVRRRGCIFTYKGHKLTVNSVKFSPDGQWIVSGGEEGNVKMWDLRAGKLLKAFANHTGSITDVEFHPNEFLLASSSVDRTVNFWDLDKLQLVSSTDRDSGPVRCVHFSEDGECLFAGSQDILKVYCWEPSVTFDTVPINWGKVHDIATTHHQLIGATFYQTNVVLFVVDLKKVRPFGGEPNQYPATFVREQSFRRSFNRDKTFPSPRPRLDVKTIEESDRSGTDPEDESQLTAEIPNVADYQAIFQPNRKLTRTPPLDPDPFPAPLDDDPTLPQIVQPPTSEQEESPSLEYREALPRGVTVREPPSPTEEVLEESTPQATSSPRATHASHRLSYTRDPMSFPEVDFPIKLSSIRHSPSEPALNRPSSSLSRNNSLGRNLVPLASRFADKPTAGSRLKQEVALVKDEPKEEEDFIPILTDKPSGLDLEEFLPKSYSRTFGYQQTFPDMSEAEVLSSMMRGHESVMTVLSSRQRSLQIVYSLWHNKDLKTAVDSAIAMSDQAVIVDLLGVILHRQSIWNLDLCATILPCIYNLVQSKYEVYMMVGCDTLRLILRNFASVIKSNVQAPIQSVGVDICREERYEKCVKCYQSLLSTRAFLLKRQTLQGKLGHTFRELHILMETLD